MVLLDGRVALAPLRPDVDPLPVAVVEAAVRRRARDDEVEAVTEDDSLLLVVALPFRAGCESDTRPAVAILDDTRAKRDFLVFGFPLELRLVLLPRGDRAEPVPEPVPEPNWLLASLIPLASVI